MSNILNPNYLSFCPSLVQNLEFYSININEKKNFEIAW